MSGLTYQLNITDPVKFYTMAVKMLICLGNYI